MRRCGTVRLFVALTPTAESLDELRAVVEPLSPSVPQLRWTPYEQWHLTLAFLGEVSEPELPKLTERLARVAARHAPIALRLEGAGRFGSRVLWLGVRGDTAGLQRLAASVRAAARRSRIEVDDRPYRPHLTLARCRDPHVDLRPVVAALAGFAGRTWTARHLQLIRSYLGAGPGGTARHEPVQSWPLGGASAGAATPDTAVV